MILLTKLVLVPLDQILQLKGSDHRVLFQNAEGNINMGVLFNDPDVDLDDIHWYNIMRMEMDKCDASDELIAFDEELNTYSCYVELHREG